VVLRTTYRGPGNFKEKKKNVRRWNTEGPCLYPDFKKKEKSRCLGVTFGHGGKEGGQLTMEKGEMENAATGFDRRGVGDKEEDGRPSGNVHAATKEGGGGRKTARRRKGQPVENRGSIVGSP